ncbi:DEP domain-containing protein 1A-like isoform X2 [Uloborus diversus]|uniref:DEP domain-containing protein 1A-like isoform X2 n=1 Tax=Uloborus diversus TaxID=327109 RepID=UPI00240A934B|nr:DEP domain-containing protein 1A-like isoform X2 [Uloborus diversus]
MESKEPYRATKLWNEVITAFQSGMPLKKHRRLMNCYDNCFMASDGVTWLHCYLLNNPNFGPEVTRSQTINLLQKFLKCHVIENITKKSKKREFCDSSDLYRFIAVSPQKTKILPLRLIQSPSLRESAKKQVKDSKATVSIHKPLQIMHKENLPECRFVEKKMSLSEIEKNWKSVAINMLEKHMNCPLSDIVEETALNGHFIRHNVSRISKTGVVTLIDKTDDIPHWVISAMKCLANWPNASGSGSCLPNYPGFEKDVFKVVRDFFLNTQSPLLPEAISSVLLHAFCSVMKINCRSLHNSPVPENKDNCKTTSLSPGVKTSTPVTDHANSINYPAMSSAENDGKILLDDPEAMWDYPSSVLYETDFATSDPITRVVPDYFGLAPSHVNHPGSMESISTISVCSITLKADLSSDQFSPLKSWNSDFHLSNLFHKDSRCRNVNGSTDETKLKLRHTQSMSDFMHVPENEQDCLNTSNASTKTITNNGKKLSFDSLSLKCVNHDSQNDYLKESSSAICFLKNVSSPFHNGTIYSGTKIESVSQHKKEDSYPEELKIIFQIILLFLSPPNRRQLHLLLRVINKILKNGNFVLDVNTSMRNYLLGTFLPAIIQANVNENIMFDILNYLLDNCEHLFQPPNGLKEEVEKLSKQCNGRQYEDQKVSVSTKALKSLLNSIIEDKNLAEKERKKRLKQFKENHAEVYYAHFPEEWKPRSKKSFLNKIAIRL